MFTEYLKTPIGTLAIEADENVITAIRLVEESSQKLAANLITNKCVQQLTDYFLGKRRTFDLPLSQNGTEFQKSVWQELCKIGYGETRTYSDIASSIGCPGAYRAVGGANHRNSLPIVVPCHRVIGKDSKLVGYALGVDRKAWLLEHETLKGVESSLSSKKK